jgi:hypothetical protein
MIEPLDRWRGRMRTSTLFMRTAMLDPPKLSRLYVMPRTRNSTVFTVAMFCEQEAATASYDASHHERLHTTLRHTTKKVGTPHDSPQSPRCCWGE